MKRSATALVLAASMALATPAAAHVKDVRPTVGRLLTPQQCFVAMYLQEVIDNQFNGNEKLFFAAVLIVNFVALQTLHATLAQGKTVLAASPSFATAAGIEPDLEITDEQCATLAEGTAVKVEGSFSDDAGELTLPSGFGANKVATADKVFDLTTEEYEVKSLTATKTIGTAGSTSSSSSSSSSSSGGTTSGGTPPPNNDPTPTTQGGGNNDDGGCNTSGAGLPGGVLSAGLLGAALVLARRRRRA